MIRQGLRAFQSCCVSNWSDAVTDTRHDGQRNAFVAVGGANGIRVAL
jgi:23S rRNA pseudoU1915 N3-methylase RlmH